MKLSSLWFFMFLALFLLQSVYLLYLRNHEELFFPGSEEHLHETPTMSLQQLQKLRTIIETVKNIDLQGVLDTLEQDIQEMTQISYQVKQEKTQLQNSQVEFEKEGADLQEFTITIKKELQNAKSLFTKSLQQEREKYWAAISKLITGTNSLEIEPDYKTFTSMFWDQKDWDRAPLYIIFQGFYKTFEWTVDQWFTKVKRPVVLIFDKNGTIFKDHSIIVVTHLMKDPNHYFSQLESKGITKYGVIHTGDIKVDQKYDWYRKPQFIYRNHWVSDQEWKNKGIDDIIQEKVRFLPCGSIAIRSLDVVRMGAHILPADKRSNDFAFVGTVLPYRAKFLNHILNQNLAINNSFTINEMNTTLGKVFTFFGEFRNEHNLDEFTYRRIISDTKFVLCPHGTGSDSFRIYEALELGAIPIIEDGAEHSPFGKHPLPTVPKEDWSNLITFKEKYLSGNSGALKELQKDVNNWWVIWKESLRLELTYFIDTKIYGYSQKKYNNLLH